MIICAEMKRAAVLALSESGKRPRRGDGDESDSSEESLEGTKRPEELKAITWKLCEPAPVKINGEGGIAVQGNTVYVSAHDSNTLYEFNADKGEWVCSIECDRKSFGLAVINGDVTLVGGKSLTSTLKTLTSLVKNRSGEKWIQKYPSMSECRANVCCYNDDHLLIVGLESNMEVMDIKRKKWKSVKFPNDYGEISAMTILGDRVYVLSHHFYYINRYSIVSTCSLSALFEFVQHSTRIAEPLVWHKLHPMTDLYRPFLVNVSGNLVAIGGRKILNEYSDENGRDRKQYSVSPALYVYSDESNKGWKFAAYLPKEIGYPNMNFLVAPLQSDRLIVCGGDQYDDDSFFHSVTDIVHIGLLR